MNDISPKPKKPMTEWEKKLWIFLIGFLCGEFSLITALAAGPRIQAWWNTLPKADAPNQTPTTGLPPTPWTPPPGPANAPASTPPPGPAPADTPPPGPAPAVDLPTDSATPTPNPPIFVPPAKPNNQN